MAQRVWPISKKQETVFKTLASEACWSEFETQLPTLVSEKVYLRLSGLGFLTIKRG